MGLTLACRRSAIIDFATNEECRVYKLRAKGEQREQPELVEKIPETALLYSDSETTRSVAGPLTPSPSGNL